MFGSIRKGKSMNVALREDYGRSGRLDAIEKGPY